LGLKPYEKKGFSKKHLSFQISKSVELLLKESVRILALKNSFKIFKI